MVVRALVNTGRVCYPLGNVGVSAQPEGAHIILLTSLTNMGCLCAWHLRDRVTAAGGLILASTLLAIFPGIFVQPTAAAAEQRFVTIGTGGVTGVYYPSGGATCKIVNRSRSEHGVRCSVETTFGSIANIEKLRRGEIDFGYVQSDWQHHAYFGTSVFEERGAFDDLRSIFSLHSEVATIVVRQESSYHSVNDLKGARVNIGAAGSGSAASWKTLVGYLDWSAGDRAHFSELGTSELAEALCEGEIDAYFALIGHPAGLIEETQQKCDARVFGVDEVAVDGLLQDAPYYMPADIPAGLYGLKEPIQSYGAVATFVTSARMPDDIVATMLTALVDNFESFQKLHPALNGLKLEDMASGDMAAPIHPGAKDFFLKRGILTEDKANGQK